MKILITGNREYGLCQKICDLFDTMDSVVYRTVSRSTGYDLCDNNNHQKLANEFVEQSYDVFINNSALWKFNQTLLAETMYNTVAEAQKSAYFIHIGSTADTGVRGSAWRYPIEKKSIKDFNRNLSYATIGGSNIKTTLISPGSLTTESVMKKHPDRKLLDTSYIAELIVWLLNQPEYVNINEISLDPIQSGQFARER
jgi:NADP-dependent 3-hydroxy acid dehydrogenase YdfG